MNKETLNTQQNKNQNISNVNLAKNRRKTGSA